MVGLYLFSLVGEFLIFQCYFYYTKDRGPTGFSQVTVLCYLFDVISQIAGMFFVSPFFRVSVLHDIVTWNILQASLLINIIHPVSCIGGDVLTVFIKWWNAQQLNVKYCFGFWKDSEFLCRIQEFSNDKVVWIGKVIWRCHVSFNRKLPWKSLVRDGDNL